MTRMVVNRYLSVNDSKKNPPPPRKKSCMKPWVNRPGGNKNNRPRISVNQPQP